MKVLVIGKGGREHAIAEAVRKSPLVSKIYITPYNVGVKEFATPLNIDESNIDDISSFAKKEKIDLTIVGPENVLALGIADVFKKNNLKIFAPIKNAAYIETSKHFCKTIMKKYNIPTAGYKVFTDLKSSCEYVESVGAPIVIKEDGLKQGKGVTVAMTKIDAINALNTAFKTDNKVVIEEFLDGQEFSLIAMVNGENVSILDPARDYKRVFKGDKGDNTGGMGAFSPVSYITDDIKKQAVESIIKPMAKALVKEGCPFTGFMYAGLILTKSGVKTIEFNARLGDPEAHVILPRIKGDFVKIILDILDGKNVDIEFAENKALCVVLASEGYPKSSTAGSVINIEEDVTSKIIHMGTKLDGETLKTNGGRVLSVVSMDKTIKGCVEKAYADVAKIHCEHLFYREDIGVGIDD